MESRLGVVTEMLSTRRVARINGSDSLVRSAAAEEAARPGEQRFANGNAPAASMT